MNINNALNRVEDIVDYIKEYDIQDLKELADLKELRKLIKKNEEIEVKKKNNVWIWILAIIGAVVVCAAIGYCIYKFLVPDYLEDFDDDDFDDDFFDDDDDFAAWNDDEDEIEVKPVENSKEDKEEE